MHPKHAHKQGYTLIELSISLIVLSLVASGIMTMLAQEVRRTKQLEMTVKSDAILKALVNYRNRYKRLPCPANPTLAVTNASYGMESSTSGVCTPTFNDNNNTIGGVLPVRTLELPDTAMFDAWGGRLMYVIDRRVAEGGTPFDTYKADNTNIGSITIKDSSDTLQRTDKAIVAIISFGPNGHGAYQLNGTRKNSGSTNEHEQINCHCYITAGAVNTVTFGHIFYQQEENIDYSDINNSFDDIVTYYVRSQLLSYAESH